jgi:hypothetical protein
LGGAVRAFAVLSIAILAAVGTTPASADTTVAPAEGARAPHPEPRVIIEVSAKRASDAAAIQAAARRGFWGKAVGCYKPALADHTELEVDASFQIEVRGGRIADASAAKPRGSKRGGKSRPSGSAQVSACVAKRLVGLEMPGGLRSSAKLRLRLAPGDPPQQPSPP